MKKFFVLLFGLIILILIGGCQNLGDLFPFLNRAPIITSEPVTTALEGNLYSYQVEVSDPDGDTLVYFFTLKPEGMNINDENGLITWTPTNDQVGMHQVIIEISDGKHSVQQNFEIEVVNVNNPPQILSYFPANLGFEINEGDSVKFEVQAHDIDLNTTLNYQWFLNGNEVLKSTGSGNDSKSSWIYSFGYGDYGLKTVKVLISDGEFTDSVQWKINVKDITSPNKPTLSDIISPTNVSSQILSGTKEANTAIWINGAEVVPMNSETTWSYTFELVEGNNNISITSRDAAGNESSAVIATIEYDPNIYVDAGNATGTEDGTKTYPFHTIAEGIDAVAPGKSVIVSAGTYNEQLVVNKGITLQGAGKESAFIIGLGYAGNLITITADNVIISGFNIDGESDTDMGIYSDSSSSIEISENLIQNHQDSGIFYQRISDDYPSGIYVYNNEICLNSQNGIKVMGAGSGIIESNIIRKNDCGIKVSNNASLEVKKNDIYDNYDSGIFCRESSSLLIWENEIRTNSYGIRVGEKYSDTTNPDIGGGAKGGIGKNNITGNTSNGIINMTDHNIFAKYNWWGDANGPKYPGNNSSSGDWAYWDDVNNKTGAIIFEDYLIEPQTF